MYIPALSVRAMKDTLLYVHTSAICPCNERSCNQLFVTQVKKLVQKMVTRDTLSYRKMTDRPQVKDVTAEVEMKDVTAPQEEKADLDDKTLAQGDCHDVVSLMLA